MEESHGHVYGMVNAAADKQGPQRKAAAWEFGSMAGHAAFQRSLVAERMPTRSMAANAGKWIIRKWPGMETSKKWRDGNRENMPGMKYA